MYHILTTSSFALDLLREKRILVTHGRGFHWEQPDHFRIVYLPEIEVLQEACGKLEDFLKPLVSKAKEPSRVCGTAPLSISITASDRPRGSSRFCAAERRRRR